MINVELVGFVRSADNDTHVDRPTDHGGSFLGHTPNILELLDGPEQET